MADTQFTGELQEATLSVNPFFGTMNTRDSSRDNMEYDEEYRALTGKSLSPFAALAPFDALNARLDALCAFIGEPVEKEEEDDALQYDPLSGVDYVVDDKDVEHALDMARYKRILLKASFEVDTFARETGEKGRIRWSFKTRRSLGKDDEGNTVFLEGNDALQEYKETPFAFTFDMNEKGRETSLRYGEGLFSWTCTFGKARFSLQELDGLAVKSLLTPAPLDRENASFGGAGIIHARPVHWLFGEKVEVRYPRDVFVRGAGLFNLVTPSSLKRMVVKDFVPLAFMQEIDGVIIVSPVKDSLVRIKKSGSGMKNNPSRALAMDKNVEKILSVLGKEPLFAVEIGEKVGMSKQQVSKVLKTALSAGLVKSVEKKTRDYKVRPAFFL